MRENSSLKSGVGNGVSIARHKLAVSPLESPDSAQSTQQATYLHLDSLL